MRPPDQAQREAAARTFDRNVLVMAGAGSGKTTLLVERLLNLVLGLDVALPSVMALTFTEKAASEMRARLAAQLSRVLEILGTDVRGADPASFSLEHVLASRDDGGLGVAPADVRARALRALHDLDGASIGTIHAACADLLRRHPASARLDPAFVVDDGSRTARVLEGEWTAFQARSLHPDAPEAADWRRVLALLPADIVRRLAAALLESGRAEGDASAGEAVMARLLGEIRELLEACERIPSLSASPNCNEWADLLARRLRFILEHGPAAFAQAARAESVEWPTKNVPAPGKKCVDGAFVTATLERARKLTDELIECDDAACEAALRLARALATLTRARLDAEGIVSFSELLVRARDVLLRDVAARRAVQGRIRALLLDEFQDTDPLQYEIVFLLAEDAGHPLAADGDPWQARLHPGRLFIVGDAKQSIYRFRGADMAAASRAARLVESQGALRASLVANFRSREEVLEPINDLCERLIVEQEPYQPAYERLLAARVDARSGAPCVEAWSVTSGGKSDEWRLAEGRCIARRIRAWRETGAIEGYGQVVILLRAMTAAEPYQRALAEAGVPYVTQGGKGFFRRPEIVQAISLLRCLVRPHDGPSLLAMLRSPSCGADDAEIHRLSKLGGRNWSLHALQGLAADRLAEVPRAARLLSGLRALAERVAELPADEAVREALLGPTLLGPTLLGPTLLGPTLPAPALPAETWQAQLPALHAACRNGAQRLANLEKLVERAEDLSRSEGLSLARIVSRLEEEMEDGAGHGESPLADEAVEAVRILTIHLAKGLEFHTVILPDVGRQELAGRHADVAIAARDGMLGLHLDGVTNVAWRMLADEDLRHEEAERRRLLHVALTRARERLILVNGNMRPRSPCVTLGLLAEGWGYDGRHPAGGEGLHAGIVHVAESVLEAGDESDAGEDAAGAHELAQAVLAGDRARDAMQAARRPRPRSPTGLKEAREQFLARDEPARSEAGVSQPLESVRQPPAAAARVVPRAGLDRSLSRAIGVAVHLALEAGALEAGALASGSLGDAEELAAMGRRAATLAATEAGADAEAAAEAAERLLRALASSPLARELAGARVLARELPFLMAGHDGSDWQGFVDLVVERDGQPWVIDWKTDAAADPERHRPQLEAYAEAVRRWLGLEAPPRMALAYVALGRLVELDA